MKLISLKRAGIVIGTALILVGWPMMYSLEYDTVWSLPIVLVGLGLIVASTRLSRGKWPAKWSKGMRDFGR